MCVFCIDGGAVIDGSPSWDKTRSYLQCACVLCNGSILCCYVEQLPCAIPEFDNMAIANEDIGVSAKRERQPLDLGLARVMSPTGTNSGVLMGFECMCAVCQSWTAEPVMCATCGVYGHAVCLGTQLLQNYMFCQPCAREVTKQYAAIEDAQQRQE